MSSYLWQVVGVVGGGGGVRGRGLGFCECMGKGWGDGDVVHLPGRRGAGVPRVFFCCVCVCVCVCNGWGELGHTTPITKSCPNFFKFLGGAVQKVDTVAHFL